MRIKFYNLKFSIIDQKIIIIIIIIFYLKNYKNIFIKSLKKRIFKIKKNIFKKIKWLDELINIKKNYLIINKKFLCLY